MRVLLLVSAFNGLTQRVWCHLNQEGHEVGVELAPAFGSPEELTATVEAIDPDLILAPFLKHRVPQEVWGRWTTVIVHPGAVGDRGPSSLDHAILDRRDRWGVTALSAVEAMDAGPVWATSTFPMPAQPTAKSALYNGPVADAAMRCIDEVLRKVAAGEQPVPADQLPREIPGTDELPLLRRADFALDWRLPADELARRIAAADGAPGTPAVVDGRRVCLFDAVVADGPLRLAAPAAPGTVVGHDGDAVALATSTGVLWVGYAAELGERRGPKLPARLVLDPDRRSPFLEAPTALAETVYERDGDVGYLTLRSYNGAMHTEQCLRMTSAVEKALTEDTTTLVLRGTEHAFSNGIHLGMIDASADPAAEAWANIQAIDDLCETIAQARQRTIVAITANAGAGGVMAALCADVVVVRGGVVLNPYYDMGIFGSELHTWALPARVGDDVAEHLLSAKLPVGAAQAVHLGLVDGVGPRDSEAFGAWLAQLARSTPLADHLSSRIAADAPGRPLSYYRTVELAEMARDLFDDRHGFAARRRDFLRKAAPTETPQKLRFA